MENLTATKRHLSQNQKSELSRRRLDLATLRNRNNVNPDTVLPSGVCAGDFAYDYVNCNHTRRQRNIQQQQTKPSSSLLEMDHKNTSD
jgi:hypothetical protein